MDAARQLGTLIGELRVRRINLNALARTMGEGWQRDYLRDQVEGIDRTLSVVTADAEANSKRGIET